MHLGTTSGEPKTSSDVEVYLDSNEETLSLVKMPPLSGRSTFCERWDPMPDLRQGCAAERSGPGRKRTLDESRYLSPRQRTLAKLKRLPSSHSPEPTQMFLAVVGSLRRALNVVSRLYLCIGVDVPVIVPEEFPVSDTLEKFPFLVSVPLVSVEPEY